MPSLFKAIQQNHVTTVQALIELASGGAASKDTQGWLGLYLKATGQKHYNLNRRSTMGKTALHYAILYDRYDIAKLLIACPLVDVNKRDLENGWTPLHSALYLGRMHIVWLLLQRTDLNTSLRDWEGYQPTELFDLTIQDTHPKVRVIQHHPQHTRQQHARKNAAFDMEMPLTGTHSEGGTDLYTWGVNTSYVLGHLDLEKRSRPEKVSLHLMDSQQTPNITQRAPYIIEAVAMSKFHTAVLTSDPLYNLLICGFGRGGRLGNGKESDAQMLLTPIRWPERIVLVALGRDHTIAVTQSGGVLTFGSNEFGQLGYDTADKEQLVPRKIQAQSLKKLTIKGVAASKVHSIVYTANDLYTFGLNQGQLGYARLGNDTLIQATPKKVPMPAKVTYVAATDYATVILLETHEVFVLSNFKSQKITFPLQRFPSEINVHTSVHHYITKIVSGGAHYFAAISNLGEVFLWSCKPKQPQAAPQQPGAESKLVTKLVETGMTAPRRVWMTSRAERVATDVAIGLDQVLITTCAGYVYLGDISRDASNVKFQLVPQLQRCIRVCANPNGAYAAIRSEHHIPLPPPLAPTLGIDLAAALPHHKITTTMQPQIDQLQNIRKQALETLERHIIPASTPSLSSDENEDNNDDEYVDEKELLTRQLEQQHDARVHDLVGSSWAALKDTLARDPTLDMCFWVGERPLYCHSSILHARCDRQVLKRLFSSKSVVSGHILMRMDETNMTKKHVHVDGSSLVAMYTLLDYIYNRLDLLAPLPPLIKHSLAPNWTPDLPLLRTDLVELATLLGLHSLRESLQSIYMPSGPQTTLSQDFECHLRLLIDNDNENGDDDADVLLMLENDASLRCHELILRQRCPFFACLFDPQAAWLDARRVPGTPMRVNLNHIPSKVMVSVLKFIYTDPEDEHDLLDDVVFESSEDMMQFTLQLLLVADEFLLPGLKRLCERALIACLSLRTAGMLLQCAQTYFADALKNACHSLIQANMSSFVISGLLGQMDEVLMPDLSVFVCEQQEALLPLVVPHRAGPHVATTQVKYEVDADDMLMAYSTWIAENSPIASSSWITYETIQSIATNNSAEAADRAAPLLSSSTSSSSSSPNAPSSASSSATTTTTTAKPKNKSPAKARQAATEQWPLPSSTEHHSVVTKSSSASWHAPSVLNKTLSLRDIVEMEEAEKKSSSASPAKSSSAYSSKKMSQKERRKLQHEKQQQQAIQAAPASKKPAWGKVEAVDAIDLATVDTAAFTMDSPSSASSYTHPVQTISASTQEDSKGKKIYVDKDEVMQDWQRPGMEESRANLFDARQHLGSSVMLLPMYNPTTAAKQRADQQEALNRRGSTSFQHIQHEQQQLDDWIKGKRRKPLLQIQREEIAMEAMRQYYVQTLSIGSGEWFDMRLDS
ncbi:hypothetical protein BC940DRAFT_298179 [Gongronella butleri]|nr:hypothetical protein BC940DRAFT_298179 [Gongronella butleri]